MTEMEPFGTWDMLWYGARVLMALVVIVPMVYYVLRYFGQRLSVNRSLHGSLTLLDVLPLGGGKQLLLVKVGRQILLLGSGKDHVSFISEVNDSIAVDDGELTKSRDLEGVKQWVKRWRGRGAGEQDECKK
ncbi:MAG: flagellar biosynthetic protein FliO [Firmicutes bacterium]|nr:flagellar biosynthetic protein FliO [Bacillota bacterium]